MSNKYRVIYDTDTQTGQDGGRNLSLLDAVLALTNIFTGRIADVDRVIIRREAPHGNVGSD